MPSSEQAPVGPYQTDNTVSSDYQGEDIKPRSGSNKRSKTKRKHEARKESEGGGEVPVSDSNGLTLSALPSNQSPIQTPTAPDLAPTALISSPASATLNTYTHSYGHSNEVDPNTEWAKTAILGRSPPNGFDFGDGLIAGSPPRAVPQRDQHRGGFSHTSPPASPSAAYRKLVRPNPGYQSFGDYLGSSPGHPGPAMIRSPNNLYTPPPHQPQAHFYGAPELEFGRTRPQMEGTRYSKAWCCMFDSLATAGEECQRANSDIILVGSMKRMDVYSIGRSKPTLVGSLEGLRGAVLGAKLLPAQSRNDPLHFHRPLIVVVVHGVYEHSKAETESRPGTSDSQESLFDPSGSMLHALHAADTGIAGGPTYYQTTVEVYSLKSSKHLVTLLRTPKVKAEIAPDYRSGSTVPSGVSLIVQASNRFIVVGSGASGELFVFDSGTGGSDGVSVTFKCLGKFWTRTSHKRSRSLSVSSDSSETERSSSASPGRSDRPDVPIFSLNHRWLAVVPPLATTQKTMHATVDKELSPQKVPGLTSHTSPTEPPPNCEIDTPEAESLINKVARDMTQELMKGARWVGGQGMQAWNNYWSKAPERNATGSPSSYSARPSSMPHSQPSFPPTHANDTRSDRQRSQLTSVSLLDLEKLTEGQRLKPDKAMQPIATFSLPYGCSFVSFAPSGLHLLTTSGKGDVQQVWSLLRMLHGEAGRGATRNADARAPFIREIKRFTRMTEASIVDVVWAQPRGEKLAIVTERGTVHIYDMPSGSFQWPPPRRVLQPATTDAAIMKPSPNESIADATSRPEQPESRFGAAFNVVAGRTQPLFAAVRGRPVSAGSVLAGWKGLAIPAGAGTAGSKAVSAGLNKSIGAATGTVNSLRHLGENRLSLPTSLTPYVPRCVKWLGGRNQGFIAAVGGEVVKIHSVTPSTNPKAGKRRSSVIASRPLEFPIPTASEFSRRSQGGSGGSEATMDHGQRVVSAPPNGFWQLPPQSHQSKSRTRAPHPLSCAEIETNAPYQPFHTDRRVGFSIHDDDSTAGESPDKSSPWVFGEPIPTTTVNMGSTAVEGDVEATENRGATLENLISLQGNEKEGQQLIMTTRRKRTKEHATGEGVGEADFFEDDCEVVDFAEDRV